MLWFKKTTTTTPASPVPEMRPRQTTTPKRAWPLSRWSNKPHSGIPDCHRVPGEPPVSQPSRWQGPDGGGIGTDINPYTGRPIGKWMGRL
jgi:hypothetical protein